MKASTQSKDLVPGNLCWAKRRAAPEGKPGRNDWWPAHVLIISDMKTP